MQTESNVFQYPGVPCGSTVSVDEEDLIRATESVDRSVRAVREARAAIAKQNSIQQIDASDVVREMGHQAARPAASRPKAKMDPTITHHAADVLRADGH